VVGQRLCPQSCFHKHGQMSLRLGYCSSSLIALTQSKVLASVPSFTGQAILIFLRCPEAQKLFTEPLCCFLEDLYTFEINEWQIG
jgi:hypothetical protein